MENNNSNKLDINNADELIISLADILKEIDIQDKELNNSINDIINKSNEIKKEIETKKTQN